MIKKIVRKIRKTDIGNLLHREYWYIKGKNDCKNYDDYSYITKLYSKLGRELNLKNPLRYTEKLQWLKLFYRDDRMPVCSDKYEVRKYIEEKGYSELLNDLIAVYENVDDIDIESLPKKFVLKASHGSGWNLIVTNKDDVNWFIWKKIMKVWMKSNLYWFGREWNYKDQKPRIIIEKYLEDDSGELRDYKIICTNGKPRFMQIDENRSTNHKRVYVDENGMPTEFQDSHSLEILKNYSFSVNQRRMFEIAKDLCEDFPYIRVDFYECDNKIYFGELTFFGASGFFNFEPDEWDFKWGNLIELPEPNNNLDLYERINSK